MFQLYYGKKALRLLAGVCVFTVLASWLRRPPMSAAATRGLTASAAGLRAVLLGNFNAVRLLSFHDSEQVSVSFHNASGIKYASSCITRMRRYARRVN